MRALALTAVVLVVLICSALVAVGQPRASNCPTAPGVLHGSGPPLAVNSAVYFYDKVSGAQVELVQAELRGNPVIRSGPGYAQSLQTSRARYETTNAPGVTTAFCMRRTGSEVNHIYGVDNAKDIEHVPDTATFRATTYVTGAGPRSTSSSV